LIDRQMTNLKQDIRFALRSFRKTPVFSTVAILSLALGIGANTAIFTMVDQLILRLLPIRDPQRVALLAGIGRHYGGNNGRNALSYPMYQDFRDRNPVFSQMMCRYGINFTVGVSGQTEVIGGEFVSGNYFPLLGVNTALGRVFTANDDLHSGAHPYAVLSYAYWRSRFAGDPHVIGQTIRVNSFPLTIVGVSQAGFDGVEPGIPAQIRIPIAMAPQIRPGFISMFDRRQRWVNVYGRLKPGVAIAQAQAGMQPLFHQIIEDEVRQPPFRNATAYDKREFLKMWLKVMPGSQGNTNLRRQYERPLWVLMGVVGLVLLIACANLASLLTARAASRQKEIAIRLAMGASRGRMIQQLITESVLLSFAGGVAGIGLAVLMAKGLLGFLPTNISGYAISSTPDLRVLAFTFVLAVLTGLLFGLMPALQSTDPDIAPTLKDQAGNVMGGRAQVGFRKILVASQVTLSLLLLIGAGLFVRSLGNLKSLDPGFHTGNLIQFFISPRTAGYQAQASRAFFKRLEERLSALPGVRAAGLSNMALLANNEWDNSVTIEGYRAKTGESIDPHFNAVTAGYIEALGIRIVAGRNFNAKDDANAPQVALVNESFARRYFGDSPAVGRRIGLGSDPGTPTNIEIVGVINDTRYESLREEIPRQVILCANQGPTTGYQVYVRTEHDPDNAFRSIRALVHDLDPNIPISNMKTLDRQLEESLVTERMIATLSSVFGSLATALSIIGLYGVMAYMVARRSREIGIRMALGAMAGNVVWLVMREVLLLVGAGVAVALPAAYFLTKVVRAQLYGIEPNDPVSLLLATLLLVAVALAAGFVPAWRAARFDPVLVLRYE
jgi:predicted permease